MIKIFVGDCRDVLKTLPENSVHCCVTSPPYWGLRDYGVDGQLGLEETPDEYVANLVDVFREVRRVLREDGTIWLNLGDSFAGSWGNYAPGGIKNVQRPQTDEGQRWDRPAYGDTSFLPPTANVPGLKPKDLVGIPWRVAFALQADGWWLRRDIIWAKGVSFLDNYAGSSMPESVQDRPATSHEYVFLLTKSARYFYDNEAVKENSTGQTGQAASFARSTKDHLIPNQSARQHREDREPGQDNGKRNLRSVWVINPKGFPGLHFATFPPALIEPMIRAGASERGCCPRCGAPWERIIQKPDMSQRPVRNNNSKMETAAVHISNNWEGTPKSAGQAYQKWRNENPDVTVGRRPTCECDAGDPVPCTILDPFAGAGTVGLVAEKLGRDAILIELNPDYVEMSQRRILDECGQMFTEIEVK
jgi:DNA modification methylase